MIYFDHNATTPVPPAVIDAMERAWRERLAHPESLHTPGQTAHRRLQAAREILAEFWSCHPAELVFLASGTQANQAALAAAVASARGPARLIASPIEHPSLLDPLEQLQQQGHTVEWLHVDASGRIHLDRLRQLLQEPAHLVIVQGANHETGVLQPTRAISEICREHQVPWHMDAVQLVGKSLVDLGSTAATFTTISPHKFGGPRGLGVLRVAPHPPHQWTLPAFPDWESAGSLPVELIVGLACAVTGLSDQLVTALTRRRDELEDRLAAAFPEIVIHGRDVPRVAQTTSVAFPGVDRQALLMALDQRGIACASGAACRSGAAEPSPTLRAMGLPDELVQSTIRVSLGPENTLSEIDAFVATLRELIPRLRRATTPDATPAPDNFPI